MIKAAIEKISEMAGARTYEMPDGTRWADRELMEIIPAPVMPEKITLSSLDALVKMIRTEALQQNPGKTVYITCDSHRKACAFLSPDGNNRLERPVLYSAEARDLPDWKLDEKLPFEEASIALMTRYQDSNDQQYLLRLLSNITSGGKITYNDNGIATTIVTQKGIALQGNETIKPLVKLRPYRTFQELEQPESLMLVRLDERGIRFIEADGGMWKLDARKKMLAYIEEHLSEEITAGRVVAAL